MDENFTPSVNDMAAAFGVSDEPEQAPAESSAEGNPPAQETSEPEAAQQPEEQSVIEPQPKFDNKQNAAFARMRTENSQMQKTLSMLAQALGLDPKLSQDQLVAQLQNQATNSIAKQNNIDPEILRRLDHLEAINTEYNRIKAAQKAEQSLNLIKEKYKATDDDLGAFVQDLATSGFDVALPESDLEQEFIRRNFDRIVQMKVDEAVKAEQERASKAGGASKPSPKQGQTDNSEPHSINTISELEEALSQQ